MKLVIDLLVERRLGNPLLKIIIDDYITLYDGETKDSYEFTVNLPNGGHDLKIIHYGKKPDHHEHDTQGNVIVDRHVMIKGISMDDVALEHELWNGKFFPVYMHKSADEPYYISPNLYLGHNGTWKLEFVSPVISWLINQRKQGPQLDHTIFKTTSETLIMAKNFFKDLPDV